jgi:hypothetical protein
MNTEIKYNRDTKDFDCYAIVDGKREYIGSAPNYSKCEAVCAEWRAKQPAATAPAPEQPAEDATALYRRNAEAIKAQFKRYGKMSAAEQREKFGFAVFGRLSFYWHPVIGRWRVGRTTASQDFVSLPFTEEEVMERIRKQERIRI